MSFYCVSWNNYPTPFSFVAHICAQNEERTEQGIVEMPCNNLPHNPIYLKYIKSLTFYRTLIW